MWGSDWLFPIAALVGQGFVIVFRHFKSDNLGSMDDESATIKRTATYSHMTARAALVFSFFSIFYAVHLALALKQVCEQPLWVETEDVDGDALEANDVNLSFAMPTTVSPAWFIVLVCTICFAR